MAGMDTDGFTVDEMAAFLRLRSSVNCKVAADWAQDHAEDPVARWCAARLTAYVEGVCYWAGWDVHLPVGGTDMILLARAPERRQIFRGYKLVATLGRGKGIEEWLRGDPSLDRKSRLVFERYEDSFWVSCGAWASVLTRKMGFGKPYGKGGDDRRRTEDR